MRSSGARRRGRWWSGAVGAAAALAGGGAGAQQAADGDLIGGGAVMIPIPRQRRRLQYVGERSPRVPWSAEITRKHGAPPPRCPLPSIRAATGAAHASPETG